MKSSLGELLSFEGQLQESRQPRCQAFGLLLAHEMHPMSMAAERLPGSSLLPCYACLPTLMQPYVVNA